MRIVLAGLLVLGTVSAAHAFDGKRKGFVLGYGLGMGAADFSIDYSYRGVSGSIDDSEFGFADQLRIGHGFNERFVLYLGGIGVRTSTISTVITGFGANYYYSDGTPGAYLTAIAGFIYVTAELEVFRGSNGHFGGGVAAGAGWEFKAHWSLEAVLGWGRASRDEVDTYLNLFNQDGPAIDTDLWFLLLTVNGLAY